MWLYWLWKQVQGNARHLRRVRRRDQPKRRRQGMPTLEALEDRLAPATISVISTDDNTNPVITAGHAGNAVDPFLAPSLRSAILFANASAGADVIAFDKTVFPSGTPRTITLNIGELQITDDVSINGTSADVLKVQRSTTATSQFRIFEITSGTVSLSGLTIANGNATFGGGIENQGTLTVSDCSFTGNSAFVGAGIDNEVNALLTVSGSSLSTNSAIIEGGGIQNAGTLTVSSSIISHNTADGAFGGGIKNIGSLTVTGSTLSFNSAHQGGGIVNESGHTLIVSNSTLSDNSAPGGAGGIYNKGTLTVTHSSLLRNSAISGVGGGLHNSGSATISNSTLSDNSASAGGGIRNQGTLTATNSFFVHNSASNEGGGIFTTSGLVTVNGGSLSRNSALAGGAIYNDNALLMISGSTLSANSAATFGGALFNGLAGTVVVSASTLFTNTATSGGGGIMNFGALTVSDSTLTGNSALLFVPSPLTLVGFGGGIYNESGTLTVSSTTISGNSASASGGGIYSPNVIVTPVLRNTIVAGNFEVVQDGSGGVIAGAADDVSGSLDRSGSFNLIGAGIFDSINHLDNGVNGNQVGTSASPIDARLGPLQDNGGPTQTMALLAGSPAIDAGSNALAAADGLTTDQRGADRQVGPRVDIGAFEFGTFFVNSLGDGTDATPLADGRVDTDPARPGDQVTLRAAIAETNALPGRQIIRFSVTGPITLTGGQLVVGDDLAIHGPGAGNVILNGNGASRALQVNGGTTVALSDLAIANGNAGNSDGGGLHNDGTLTLHAVNFLGNTASSGGAIGNFGTLTLDESSLAGNSAGSDGGAILNLGDLTLAGSTLSDNSAARDGGALHNLGTLTATNSTVSGNAAGRDGGGLDNPFGTARLTNVTVASNRADADINGSGAGGGIRGAGGTVVLGNTIVSGNFRGSSAADDVFGSLSGSSSFNLIGGDARLGPLQDNGGPTRTMALLAGSPALDAGSNALAAAPGLTTDQRGRPRGTVDIGAFEAHPWVSAIPDQTTVQDMPVSVNFTVGDLVLAAATPLTSLAAVSSNPTLLPDANLVFSGTGASRTLTITPAAGQTGTAALFVTITAGSDSMTATFLVTVKLPNQSPLVTTSSAALPYTENDPATAIDANLTVSDVDSATLAGATVQITGNYVSGEDRLGFTDTATIKGTFDVTTGTLTLQGTDTVAAYQAALRSVSYFNSSDNPSTATRAINFTANDGGTVNNLGSASRSVSVTAVNDAPVVTTSSGALAYTENQAATAIDPNLIILDVDSVNLTGATVRITANYVSGQDVLGWTGQPGISGNFDATTGMLTLSGSASVAAYQAALRSVTYFDNSDNPSTATRAVNFTVNDGSTANNLGSASRSVSVTAVDDAPVNNVPGTQTVAKNGSLVFSSVNGNQVSVSDVDAGSALIQVTLTVSSGTLTLGSTTGLFFAPGSDGIADATMTFRGTIQAINAALNGMLFTARKGFTGTSFLTITTSDGALSDTDQVAIIVK